MFKVYERCIKCNEFLLYQDYKMQCRWDHSKPFCKLHILRYWNKCTNHHKESSLLCILCNMLERKKYLKHKYDGNKCKVCNVLLNYGKCIYGCVNGGIFCFHCGSEDVVNNTCYGCMKDNSGQLTKRSIK